MRDYTKFSFWVDAHQLAVDIYDITKKFPKNELYGITSQLRRSSLSVPTNIAEGCGRESLRELKRFLVIANGSITEVHYLLYFCFQINIVEKDNYTKLRERSLSIKKRISAYIRKMK